MLGNQIEPNIAETELNIGDTLLLKEDSEKSFLLADLANPNSNEIIQELIAKYNALISEIKTNKDMSNGEVGYFTGIEFNEEGEIREISYGTTDYATLKTIQSLSNEDIEKLAEAGIELPRSIIVSGIVKTSEGDLVLGQRTSGDLNIFGGVFSPNELRKHCNETGEKFSLDTMLRIELLEELGLKNIDYHIRPIRLHTMPGYPLRVEVICEVVISSSINIQELFRNKGNELEHKGIVVIDKKDARSYLMENVDKLNPSLKAVVDIL